MSIIRFPLAAQEKRNSHLKLRMEQPNVPHNNMHLGPWTFECTRCDAPMRFESNGMIFKKIDLYCASCGHHHTVTNPAFAPSTPTKTK